MKIELDEKDGAALQGGILDAIKNLSPEKRDEVVAQVMLTFLTGPDKERAEFDARINASSSYGYDRVADKARYRSTRERILEALTTASADEARKQVDELVKTDKLLVDAYDKIKAVIVKNFPDMVQHEIAEDGSKATIRRVETRLSTATTSRGLLRALNKELERCRENRRPR